MSAKEASVAKYNVWIHIEGVNEEDDTIQGDEYHEPKKAGCLATLQEAENLRDCLLEVAEA